jgi:hypothetical protein
MKFQRPYILLLVLILLAPVTAARKPEKRQPASPASRWYGQYSFEELGGKNTGMVIGYSLKIYRAGDLTLADIDADGFQTQKRITCSTRVEGRRIHIYFRNYRKDNLFEIYRPGEWLLSLERKGGKILTYWRAMKPQLIGYRNGRVYFQR